MNPKTTKVVEDYLPMGAYAIDKYLMTKSNNSDPLVDEDSLKELYREKPEIISEDEEAD